MKEHVPEELYEEIHFAFELWKKLESVQKRREAGITEEDEEREEEEEGGEEGEEGGDEEEEGGEVGGEGGEGGEGGGEVAEGGGAVGDMEGELVMNVIELPPIVAFEGFFLSPLNFLLLSFFFRSDISCFY